MYKKVQAMQLELQNCSKLPIFEVQVTNRNTGEVEYIIFDLVFRGNTFIAQHIPLTRKETRSKKIANKKLVVDTFFSLDHNLQEMYSCCIESIIDSDYFDLSEDN